MIQTAYVDSSNYLKARLDNGSEQIIAYNVQLQGFTSEGVTFKEQGYIKIWHENGSVETINYVG